jgi:hypothetical protein
MPSLHCPHECCILLQCRFASLDNPHATVSCRELLLHPAVHKCHAMCFHAVGQAIAPSLQWVSHFIANTRAVRFLCLHLMPCATWTSNWSHVVQWPEKTIQIFLAYSVLPSPQHQRKLHSRKASVAASIQLCMEVWFPCTTEGTQGAAGLSTYRLYRLASSS